LRTQAKAVHWNVMAGFVNSLGQHFGGFEVGRLCRNKP
jgi:hypothetical protein